MIVASARDRAFTERESVLTSNAESEVRTRLLKLANGGLDRAFRVAGLILEDSHEAEDATQEALVRAWRSAKSLRDEAKFSGWFDRILINVCRDRLRRRGSVTWIALEDHAKATDPDDPFRAIASRDEIVQAMRTLTNEERVVVVLHYWADLTLDDVAERLGWPVGTVKSRLHRALAAIRRGIDETTRQDSSR